LADEEDIINDMMETSDGRRSFDDIWTLACGNVTFYYYTITLVPWFYFAQHLVRVRYQGAARRLIAE